MEALEDVLGPVPEDGLIPLNLELASSERSSKVDASKWLYDPQSDAYANRVVWLDGVLGGGTGCISNARATAGSALG